MFLCIGVMLPLICFARNNIFHFSIIQTQCDQIGQFIALWATFQSLWRQLFCPNHPHFRQLLSKIFNFSSGIIFGQLLSTLGDFYWSHWFQPISSKAVFRSASPTFVFLFYIFYFHFVAFEQTKSQHNCTHWFLQSINFLFVQVSY